MINIVGFKARRRGTVFQGCHKSNVSILKRGLSLPISIAGGIEMYEKELGDEDDEEY